MQAGSHSVAGQKRSNLTEKKLGLLLIYSRPTSILKELAYSWQFDVLSYSDCDIQILKELSNIF